MRSWLEGKKKQWGAGGTSEGWAERGVLQARSGKGWGWASGALTWRRGGD